MITINRPCHHAGCQTVSICQDIRLHVTWKNNSYECSTVYVALQLIALYLHDKYCKRIPWHLMLHPLQLENLRMHDIIFNLVKPVLFVKWCWLPKQVCWNIRTVVCTLWLSCKCRESWASCFYNQQMALLTSSSRFLTGNSLGNSLGIALMRTSELRALVHPTSEIPLLDLLIVVAIDYSLLNFVRWLLVVLRGLTERKLRPTAVEYVWPSLY